MSTPRRIRLRRAPDLHGFRSVLTDALALAAQGDESDTFILVPTRAAAQQLLRTAQERRDRSIGPSGHQAIRPSGQTGVHVGTRAELYELLRDRLSAPPRMLSGFEREAMLAAGAREAEERGVPPPFHVRPALVAEMLALYDHVRRLGRTVDDFERLLTGELEPAADSDRGAAQLLEQTHFLTAAFRAYEARLTEARAADEHALRSILLAASSATPLRRLLVAVADRPFDPDGFWPADVSLLASIDGLEQIDIIATANVLDAGYLERLRLAFVEIDEAHDTGGSTAEKEESGRPPVLITPGVDVAFHYRDREDELEAVARRIAGSGDQINATALVVARPLPYLYLAREIFGRAGVPFEAVDTLPLAAEPYAAAVDVVLECAAANFTRRALMALLKSPHFTFAIDGEDVPRAAVMKLDALMAEHRYLGGIDRLRALADTWTGVERPAALAAVAIAQELAPLLESRPLVDQLELLRSFLDAHDRDHPLERRRRARAAVSLALTGLADSFRRHDPAAEGTVTEVSAAIRRWLGTQTFADTTGNGGVRILDPASARFADLDDVQILGLIDGEWPERARRNVFYPRGLIAQFEPSRPDRVVLQEERDQVRFARATFRDLIGLASREVRVSTFALESESVVEPSTFIDDLATFGLASEERDPGTGIRDLQQAAGPKSQVQEAWASVRAANPDREPTRFMGEAGEWVLPRVSVSRLERYMKCPFQFYVSNVLQVTEEPEDETARSPLERGRFLHELFETFFHEWQGRGRTRITAASIDEARRLFEEIAEPALRSLPPAEAALERARLFGSAVGSGIVDRVFVMEAERRPGIRERLMEYELDGVFTFAGEDGSPRDVRLRAKIDRVDLLEDGTFRLIDYKTKYVPDRKQALQLPIYSACVRTALQRTHGRDIIASEAMYLSFEGPQAVVPLEERGKTFDELTTAASQRLVAALDGIAAGHYPARPDAKNLCSMCAFTMVCRSVGGQESAEIPRAAEGREISRATEGAEGTNGSQLTDRGGSPK